MNSENKTLFQLSKSTLKHYKENSYVLYINISLYVALWVHDTDLHNNLVPKKLQLYITP